MMKNSDKTKAELSPQKLVKWNNTQKYVIFLLLLVHMFNLMDRQIINVLSPTIQQDFNLNDFQAVSYTHLTLPTILLV